MEHPHNLADHKTDTSNFEMRERGIVDANAGLVKSPCSTSYLHNLYLELSRARSFVMVSVPKQGCCETQLERLKFLEHEFGRLLRHPSLFPSAAMKARFMILCFHLDCEYQDNKTIKDLLLNEQLRNLKKASGKHLTKPSYETGSHGWENFLLPEAPGATLGYKKTEPASAFQVLPGVGLRICSDLAREENDLIQVILGTDGLSVGLKSLPLSLDHTESQKGPQFARWPQVRLNYHTTSVILSPSPFREDMGIRLDVRSTTPSPFESFSSMLYRAEQRGPGTHIPIASLNAPNVFPLTCVRSWHRPLRLWDLHFHTKPIENCSCQKTNSPETPTSIISDETES